MSRGYHKVLSDDTRMTSSEVEGGYYSVTFHRPDGEEETCDRCPCLSACEGARECVKRTAFAVSP